MRLLTKFWWIIGIICLIGLFSCQNIDPKQWVAVSDPLVATDGMKDYTFHFEDKNYVGLRNFTKLINENGGRVVCAYEQSINTSANSPKLLVVVFE